MSLIISAGRAKICKWNDRRLSKT